MAIDDNTSYELTGYQVKDLAGRIRLKADASAIPTVNDATLTLVQNGATVGTFTANQSTNTTVNLAGGVYADDPTAPANPDAWITSSDINWATIALGGTWTTTQSISSTGGYIQKAIDISSLGFSSADDYTVILTNRGGGANGWAVTLMVSDKTATGFKITQWNSHWSSGQIGSGNVIDWAVFRLN